MDSKEFKINFYKHSARFYNAYSVMLLAILAGWFLVGWIFDFGHAGGNFGINSVPFITLSIILFLFMATWLSVWGWYYTTFRYIIYFLAWVCSLFRRLWEKWWAKLVILMVFIHILQWARYELFFNTGDVFLDKNFITLPYIIKTLVLMALFIVFYGLIKARKYIHVAEFADFTGSRNEDPLKAAVNGLAARILNEMNRVSLLLRTIDEIQPEQKFEAVESGLNIQDYGKDLQEMVGSQSTVAIGSFLKIPLGGILNFFSRLVHGPKLQGSLHCDDDKLILTAQLKGGKFNGSWSVSSDELEEISLPSLDTGKIVRMTEILVYKIFAQLGRSGSPRWKAVMYYTRGLKLYRDSVRKKELSQLNLIEAKDAFSHSIRDDSEFVQCYYNLGIIYRGLNSMEAAEAAFRKALEVEADNHHCYYQLAYIYYKHTDYYHALWFCEQALAIYPTDPEYWNLWAYIQYKKRFREKNDNYQRSLDVPGEIIQYRMNATVLAWHALCNALIKREKIQSYKQTARICLHHLAKTTGLNLERKSKGLFRQTLFLNPDNNDLFFEWGKYLYRKGKTKKNKGHYRDAYKAFTRVFEDDIEIGDPFSFWTFYMCINAELLRITNNDRYKQGFKHSYDHFLECAAKEIQFTGLEPRNKDEEIKKEKSESKLNKNTNLAVMVLKNLNDTNDIKYSYKVDQINFIPKLITFLNEIKVRRDYPDILSKEKTLLDYFFQHFPTGSKEYCGWPTAQVKIISAKRLLEIDDIDNAILRLNDAITILEYENPYELKILGLYLHLARGYFKWNKYAQALIWAREAAKLDPYEPKVRELLVEIHFALKDYSSGLEESAISLNLKSELNLNIIKKIGNAYKERVKIQDDAGLRKKFLENAVNYFELALKIMGDKSYPVSTVEKKAHEYEENLGEIHFYLGFFLFKLKKYGEATGHFQTARKMGYKNRQNIISLGWEYIEEKCFNEAEQVFNDVGVNEADENRHDSLMAQIKLGRAAVQIERAVGFHQEDLQKKTLSLLKNAEKSIENVRETQEKNRLKFLFHRWQGLFYFKIEKYDEAVIEFEKATALIGNAVVYYYLAQTHLRLAKNKEAADRQSNLQNARTACMLCIQYDAQKQFEKETNELLKNIEC